MMRKEYAHNYYLMNKIKIKLRASKHQKEHREEKNKRSRELYYARYRRTKLAKIYKTTPEEIDKWLKIEVCQICGIHPDNLNQDLNIDHNHTTGKIRGRLCSSCNRAIGYFKENTITLKSAINYLETQ